MRKLGRSGWPLNAIPDEELIARCAHGDRHAMDVLVSRYHGKLLDFALRHFRNRDTAADIAQNTLLRAYEAAATYQARSSFRTWLYTITLNLIRDEYRRRRVKPESLASEMDTGEEPSRVRSTPSAEDVAEERAESLALWDAVGRLSENYRTAVILKFRQGLTYEEIAQVMGAPSGTVKSWVHYALKALRDMLGESELECRATGMK